MADRVVLEAENGMARYYPETDDDPDAEALEGGRRMENVSRMAWVQAGGDLFEVTALDGTFAIGPTLLRALRNLDDAPEEG